MYMWPSVWKTFYQDSANHQISRKIIIIHVLHPGWLYIYSVVDVWRNDKPFRKYYLHIKTSLSPTRHFLTHYRLLLTFLFYLKCHQHRPQLASRAIKYHFGQNIRPQARNLKKIMDHTFNRAEVYTKVGKLNFFFLIGALPPFMSIIYLVDITTVYIYKKIKHEHVDDFLYFLIMTAQQIIILFMSSLISISLYALWMKLCANIFSR